MTKSFALLLVLALPVLAKDTCLECHSALDGDLKTPATAFTNDIHARNGFGCADCHGGDRNAEDPEASMNRAKGFIGRPARTAVPKLCARCHSDANLMHRYKPQQRVDQLTQYQTSIHGKRLATGDEAVANCVDCHSVHDIREVRDALSPVHPLRIADTCGKCHNDPQLMANYGIVQNVYETYMRSFHGKATLLASTELKQLDKATCISCHGVHDIKAVSDPTSPVAGMDNLSKTCEKCHQGAGVKFASSFLGHETSADTTNKPVHTTETVFSTLLKVVVAAGAIIIILAIVRYARNGWKA